MWTIPLISAICFLIGGQWWKPARWLMGIPITVIGVFHLHYWAILAIPAYWIATSAFPYGEKSWLNFLGEYGKWLVVGLVLGACSFVLLPLWLGVLQSLLSAVSFGLLHWLDEKNIVKNPFQELLRGFCGTILFLFV